MFWRTLKYGVAAVVITLGIISYTAPAFLFGVMKHDLVNAYEQAGVDVSDCKKRKQTLLDPSGGMPECMQGAFKDIMNRMNELDRGDDRRD